MLELIVYKKPSVDTILNYSAFCGKTEFYLRLHKIDHTIHEFLDNPGKFPKAKLPVIKHNGKIIEDSAFIEKYLNKEFNIDMDSGLSDLEKAQGFVIVKMMENYLYWTILSERWFVDENWNKLKGQFFKHIPGLIRKPITGLIRGSLKKAAKGHGILRHSFEEIYQFGDEALAATSTLLGDKPFLLGDKISSYDCSAYAFVSNAVYCDLSPRHRENSKKYKNLESYCQRLKTLI